ncbi:hypothetical protein [Endozoicomonas sp. ALC066]|uniref:hypothetical protein n=1 Tax=Endozoicomonas sp. ALC066 TaxID=3403078 RepID=UPI003BB4C739
MNAESPIVLSIQKGVRVTDPDLSTKVVLQPLMEQAAGFSTMGLKCFQVVEAPSSVWAFIFNKSEFCRDVEVMTRIAAEGWDLSVRSALTERVGWGQFQDRRGDYLYVLD